MKILSSPSPFFSKALFSVLVFSCCADPLAATPVKIQTEDQAAFDAFLGHAKAAATSLGEAPLAAVKTPEDFCWVQLPTVNMMLTAWELTGDDSFGRLAGESLRNLVGQMQPGEDGRLGWYGAPIPSLADPAKPDVQTREIQTDFRALAVISRFLELAGKDPELKNEYQEDRKRWIVLMENDLLGYWHDHGYFQDLGARGGIYQWNENYRPSVSRLTLSHEKLSIMVAGLLGLYRVTGNADYALHAAKVGVWFRSCLGLKDGRYSWSRWSPAGAWDVSPEDPAKWKTWVGADPKGQWYASAVAIATELNRHGLVFSTEDISRFVATQTEVCWNGDAGNPVYFQVDGVAAKDGEAFIAMSLAPYSPALQEFVFGATGSKRRADGVSSPWRGGVLAGEWFLAKYGSPIGQIPPPENFRNQSDMTQYLSENAPEIQPPGDVTPRVPAEAKFLKKL